MMLEPQRIRYFYINSKLEVPKIWRLSRKHIRIQVPDGRFIKLNRFRNRLNEREIRSFCIKFSPIHVYFSALNWLFPERVGKKYKARYACPLNGEYVVDVDSYVVKKPHRHVYVAEGVCYECLNISKELTIQACEGIEGYYSDIAIVFSGKRGFHIHVLDFDIRDWTYYNERNPIKSHEVARYKFTKIISSDALAFDRAHFIVSVDPMRVISMPNSLNAETGLKCTYIGDRKDLEKTSIDELIYRSNPALEIYGYPEPLRAVK
jgi:DNA primase catalytic subunit